VCPGPGWKEGGGVSDVFKLAKSREKERPGRTKIRGQEALLFQPRECTWLGDV